MSDTALAVRLKAFREARGLRSADLARAAGLSKQLYAKYERGEVLPRWDAVVRLAEALGVSLDELKEETP